MMVMLEGDIVHRGSGFVVVRAGEFGYKVLLPDEVILTLSEHVVLYTHEIVRDSERELFGVLSFDSLELLWRLVSVSGVGPKSAQKIVFSAPIDRIRQHILSGDLAFLSAVPGIGKKTAQKILLELKGVFVEDVETVSTDQDALAALQSLGYSRRDAEQILSQVEGNSTEVRIREALRLIGHDS